MLLEMLLKLNVNNRKLSTSPPSSVALVALLAMALVRTCGGAPSLAAKSWPVMKNYDIWGPSAAEQSLQETGLSTSSSSSASKFNPNLGNGTRFGQDQMFAAGAFPSNDVSQLQEEEQEHNGSFGAGRSRGRSAKVLNFFPVPVDDECLSDDGLRTGQCLNAYECRIQGGSARGQCALGFGVCCIFTATCDQEMVNNITYFVSPSFPALLAKDMVACKLKIKLMNSEISQLKFDFIHFALGQPNRRTGICDGDVFKLVGGLLPFDLCGQNSGQHLYYDLNPKARADEEIELEMNFSPRSFTQRLWEIRVMQIPFSQRAPSGCMQYFSGLEGVIQTFNFAENGRHLANHNYRACIRQEKGMCSVAYEPCDDQSFRIGNPLADNDASASSGGAPGVAGGPPGGGSVAPGGTGGSAGPGGVTFSDPSLADDPLAPAADIPAAEGDAPGLLDPAADGPLAGDDTPAIGEPAADEPLADDPAADAPQADDPEVADEGSGGGDGGFFGNFFPSFFSRSMHDSYRSFGGTNRQERASRQFSSNCRDRITLPCIIEDFIGAGMGDLPSCLPVHCGNSLCPLGVSPCRVETSVTPFGLGIHFGEGMDKGSPEDNIGACLRFNQIPCAG
ncbi:uncharacterized protein LOC129779552 [Toxorhynchites rutilus septentrionalis]|uniref:uncharacterized protein LOC129779552 n=1 Tax=Toxorhynchites rutilus septentrionalis TaxID=329112 RepID=UPI002478FDEB|nr:uncharacterized protein LOC129779552 [Toxorhynchites rutilus septentrionalis]XP_055643068.1 uncharacterized protein LOC129779552 [Toxorhynchites rutilus septentrionalis]XP_055643069.1 uncharacterized protein LOC129779552 [Toxorhynchites rutilus septentrionalis]XP_055643070.1 uncharacterized protein LOC129779552 [Toxorhynchites rutilus septentrionalis]XP_055643071.1 uncharacterized protein LOC129779552 [Toxorhynchites rutilus septentrionalis]XP_055643072.1 uncharacterized protein LOC12977955